MFAHDADLGLLGKGIFEPEGKQSAFASPITTTLTVASLRGVAGGAWE
jgi:hypothetical protein